MSPNTHVGLIREPDSRWVALIVPLLDTPLGWMSDTALFSKTDGHEFFERADREPWVLELDSIAEK